MYPITLRKLNIKKDLHDLFCYMSSEEQFLFSARIDFNSKNSFVSWIRERLNNDFHDFYILQADNKTIGYVHNYDFSLQDGHCKIVVYIDEVHRQIGIGGIAAIKFIKNLFLKYPLRKIYITIYDYNKESLESNIKAGFIEEGFLKNFRYYNENYYGLHILSMNREKFFDTIGKLVE